MPDNSAHLHVDLRKRRLAYKTRLMSSRVWESTEPVIIGSGIGLVVLLQIPWLAEPLSKFGLSQSGAITQAVIVVVLGALFLQLRSLNQSIAAKPGQDRHFFDTMDVYPVLRERAKGITRSEEKVLDVLGITLYTAWPTIRFWLPKSDMSDWRIRLTAVTGVGQGVDHVPDSWLEESRKNLESAITSSRSPLAENQRITIETFGHDFMPVLHGFRLGNGDLFFSILLWDPQAELNIEGYSYEFVPREDDSDSAEAMREVFDSWFQRASSSTWPPQRLTQV